MNLKSTIKLNYGSSNAKLAFHYSPRNKLLYINNPKAGCSTIKTLLSKYEANSIDYDSKDIHQVNNLLQLSDLTWQGIEDLIGDPNVFVFSFVRNPCSRLVSAYVNKLSPRASNKVFFPEINLILGREKWHPIEFEDFICALETSKLQDPNPHWRPQVCTLIPSFVDYDLIGKLENFQKDFEYILNRVPGKFRSVNVHKNSQSYKLDIVPSESQIKRIKKLYAEDYEVFNY